MSFCTECGEKLKNNEVVCPKCGARQEVEPTKPGTKALIFVLLIFVFLAFVGSIVSSSEDKTKEKQVDETRIAKDALETRIGNVYLQKSKKIGEDLNNVTISTTGLTDYAKEDNKNPGYIAKHHKEFTSEADTFVSQVLLITYEIKDFLQYIEANNAVLKLNKSVVTSNKEAAHAWLQSTVGILNATKTRLSFTDRTYGTNSRETIQHIDEGIATVQNFNEALRKDMAYSE